jgi:tetratricopeptide (TPR) repeat protein
MKNMYKLLEEGKHAFEKQYFATAKKLFLEFIEKEKKFADVYNHLGYIYFSENNFAEAIYYYKKAVEINPSYTEAIINLIIVLQLSNDLNTAEYYMEKMKQFQETEGFEDRYCLGKIANKHWELAKDYNSLCMHNEALEEYEKALKLGPNFFDIRLDYAITLRDCGKIEESVFELDKIIKNKPDYVDAYIHLGICYYKQGYMGFAIDAWQKGYALNPENNILQSFLYILDNAEEIG